MCGRFTLTADVNVLQKSFPWLHIPRGLEPRYNIAPTQPVAVVSNNGDNHLDYYNWGLIPSWAKDASIGSRMINARSETVDQKPSFRAQFKYRRCLVLADGFYEWRKIPGKKAKIPMYVHLKSKKPFAFAGLWDIWHSSDGSEIRSCNIITTEPNSLLKNIHNRMPVILSNDNIQDWLSPGEMDTSILKAMLRPYPSEEMDYYTVSTIVNKPANEMAECIIPAP